MAVSRRRFLRISAGSLAGLSLVLAGGCSSPPAPAPSAPAAPAAKPPAPAPTAAPAAKPAAPAPTAAPAAKPTAAAGPQPQSGGELIVGVWQDPLSLDPSNANGIAMRPVMLMFDTLVVMGDDLKFHPALAESWQVSPDGKSYTFKLKSGVKFHDGTPFNAAAVKASLDHATRTEAKATFSISLRGIYEKTDVVDDLTARVVLKQAFAPFLDGISEGYYGITSPTAVQKLGKDFDRNPVGTGPFAFVEWVSKSHVTVKRNPDYRWGPATLRHQGPGYPDKVSFRLIPESSTRIATLETGEVLVAEEVPPEEVDRLKKEPAKYRVISRTYPGAAATMMINLSKPPLNELAVRQAVQHAVDQDELVKVLFQSVYTAARAPISPGSVGYDQSLAKLCTTDRARGKELLDGAGWKPGSDGIRQKDGKSLEFSINVISDLTATVRAAELLQAQLREVGIKLEIKQMSTAAWSAANLEGSQQMLIGWRAASDPDFMRQIYHSSLIGKSAQQRTHIRDERLDQLLDQGPKELDPAKRAAIYREAQEIILKAAVIVPLWDRYNFVGMRTNVRDLDIDPKGFPRLNDVWLAK